MPGIKTLLRDALRKYPEIENRDIGIYYLPSRMMKDDAAYQLVGEPLEGMITDDKGVRRNYNIEVSERVKHSDVPVKVGAISEALSTIHLHEKLYREASGLKKLATLVMYPNYFNREITYENLSDDARSRGFGKQVDAFNEYVDELEKMKLMLRQMPSL